MKLSKISLAVAAVAAIAGGAAFAGQIGSSSVTLATEVIYADTQIARAPSNVYTFAGDIDAQSNTQRFQLQYTLSAGTWNVGAAEYFSAVNTLKAVNLNGTEMLKVSYLGATNVSNGGATFPALTQINAFVTADRKTLVFNVTIPGTVGPTFLLKQPVFTINAPAYATNTAANSGITGLFSVAGAAACPAPDKNVDISFKHITTHDGTATLQTNATPDSEHLRTGSTNTARLINFTQNHILNFTGAARNSSLDAAFANFRLNGNNFPTVVAASAANTGLTAVAAVVAPVTRHYLGVVTATQRAQGADTDYAATYGDAAGAPSPLGTVGDFTAPGVGNLQNGTVETKELKVTFTFPVALPAGATISAFRANGVAAALAAATISADRLSATYTLNTPAGILELAGPAGTIAGFGAGLHFYLDYTGTVEIQQMGAVAVTGFWDKTDAPAVNREQDFTCTGTHAGVGGGIKIDLRNYASFASFANTGTSSIVRLINNSESKTADVFAQMIYADGTYGPYGLVGSLKPREVLNITNKDLEAKMTTAAPTANPFGGNTVYTSVTGAAVVAGPKAGVGDRVRFVSNTGTTLRVQSFIVSGSTILNVSDAQGVDFENNVNNRTPATAIDAQPNSQDAINGLAK